MVSAYDEITGLLYRYAESVDAGDFVAVSSLFAHATYRTDGVDNTLTGTEVGEVMARTVRLHDGRPRTKHLVSNAIVELAGERGSDPSAASARSYFTVIHDAPDHPPTVIVTGRYHDRFAHEEGTWRFADRLIFIDQVGDLSAHLHLDRMGW